MSHDIRWFAVAREDLLDVLLGEATPNGPPGLTLPLPELRRGMLALGYKPEYARAMGRNTPAIVVLEDKFIIETLSWLRVYAEEAFPISQFARVIRLSDWAVFTEALNALPLEGFRPERWAAVAVGEALAQSDAEVDLQNMPLSRIASSLSLPVGRTTQLFGQGEPTRLCADRLRTISEDTRFGRRTIPVEQLMPIWALCSANVGEHFEPSESAQMVVDAASAYPHDLLSNVPWRGSDFLKGFEGLHSDSVEQRVMAFNEFTQELSRLPAVQMANMGASLLAAGCFMVGRSTSHVFLLKRFQRVAPAAFAWFGLMAAFAGPRSWDGAWLRAVKGAERLLKPDFEWTDAPTADIGWSEFAWLAGTFDDVDQMASLPKMLPRTLGVEVVPGVALQVRLGQGASDESRPAPEASNKERALSDALNQIISVALRARGHDERVHLSDNSQKSLDLVSRPTATAGRPSRAKKGKQESDGS